MLQYNNDNHTNFYSIARLSGKKSIDQNINHKNVYCAYVSHPKPILQLRTIVNKVREVPNGVLLVIFLLQILTKYNVHWVRIFLKFFNTEHLKMCRKPERFVCVFSSLESMSLGNVGKHKPARISLGAIIV